MNRDIRNISVKPFFALLLSSICKILPLAVCMCVALAGTVKGHAQLRQVPFESLIKLYDTVNIFFIGDVMQHGYQIRSAHIPGQNPLKPSSYDYSHAFKYMKERFAKADLAVANMEFPVGVTPYSGYPHFSAPQSIVEEAIKSGIGLFQIANNHIADKGRRGIEQTLNIYDSLGVHYTGAYRNDSTELADNPKIVDIKGIRIAFINFTYGTNGMPVPSPFIVNTMDSTKVKESIKRAKQRGAQIIVALPHWGEEYMLLPSGQQKKWADMLFRNGVRIIIGTHPHVPQSAEICLSKTDHPRKYGEVEKIVFYSLGNYISNQSSPDYTQLGMAVEIKIVKNNLNGEIALSKPYFEYLWCFKKGEFAPDYTVIPVKELLKKEDSVRNKEQYSRMKNTYNFIMRKNTVKTIFK